MITFDFFIRSLFVLSFFGIIYLAVRTSPIFKHICKVCGKKDKNWDIVPTGHDDFGWQHKCDKK